MIKNISLSKVRNLLLFYLRLFGLYMLFFICANFVQRIFPDLDITKYSQDYLQEIFKNNRLKAFLAIIIFAPVIEELMFRTLIKPKISGLLLFLSSWTLFIIGSLFSLGFAWYYQYILTFIALYGIFFIYKSILPEIQLEKVICFLNRHQSVVLQVTSLIFGFIHISNYVDSFQINSTLVLLITPRIIAGHMFGQLKIKNDHIIWSILLHALNNGIVFLIISSK